MNKICVYAICKNEEKHIRNWLDAIIPVDEIVILDTGSKDKTIDIIEEYQKTYDNINLYHGNYGEDFQFHYGAAKYDALDHAYWRAQMNDTTHDVRYQDWIFVNLDIDEYLNEGAIDFLENIPKLDFDTISIMGITELDYGGESTQILTHRVHTYNRNFKWIRSVHEALVFENKEENDKMRTVILDSESQRRLSFTHHQDPEKSHDYYNALQYAYEIYNDRSVDTLAFYAWEAANRNEMELCAKLSTELLNVVTTNKDDYKYLDWQCISQALVNIILYGFSIEDNDELKNKVLNEVVYNYIYFTGSKLSKDFVKTRSLFYYLFKAAIAINNYTLAAGFIKELLRIKERPFCWFDNSDHYKDDNQWYDLLASTYHLNNNNDKANTYAIVSAFNRTGDTIVDEVAANLDIYRDNTIRKIDDGSYDLSINQNCIHGVYLYEYVDKIIEDGDYSIINNLEIEEASKFVEKEILHKEEVEMEEVKTPVENSTGNKVCVYAICKNEAQFVDRWYESMKEADLIVVLDTGSTDNTVELLEKHGVTVVQKVIDPWRFDVARNESLALCPPEYNILVSTDLDEVLDPGWSKVLREKWIEGVHERAVYKYAWSTKANGEPGRIFQYDKIHSRNWVWKYPVHELLWNTISNTNGYNHDNTLDLFEEVYLHHYPDYSKSRGSYLPLLELRAEENPDDYYGLIYLAHEYYYRKKYEKSIETLDKVLEKYKGTYNSVEKASCYLFKGDSYKELGDIKNAIFNYNQAMLIDSTYREPYINLAKVFMELNAFEEAIPILEDSIKNTYRHYVWLERDQSWGSEPWDLLSLSYYYKKNPDYNKSLLYAVKAYREDNGDERLKKNIDMIMNNMKDMDFLK